MNQQMENKTQSGAIVVTSISEPCEVLRVIASLATKNKFQFLIVGDKKSPIKFELDGCQFLGLEDQFSLPFSFKLKDFKNSFFNASKSIL